MNRQMKKVITNKGTKLLSMNLYKRFIRSGCIFGGMMIALEGQLLMWGIAPEVGA